MNTPRLCLAVATALLMASGIRAAEVGGVRIDDHASVAGQELALNGAGIRTKLMFKVYVASLYLPHRASDLPGVLAQAPRRIQLNLLRGLSADQLVDALNEGLEANNSPAELAAVKTQSDQLSAIMKAFKEVKEKDVVALDFVEGATRISWNGESKGTIPGAAFNEALTRIWLGDKAVQPDLKKSLLGG
ncbi:MAG TPA: chalcone isomerase family protein [Casimicrobiaceae bacterium]|nr:chalcone isomerase family protein [Casimicrobiaceae bacterium]